MLAPFDKYSVVANPSTLPRPAMVVPAPGARRPAETAPPDGDFFVVGYAPATHRELFNVAGMVYYCTSLDEARDAAGMFADTGSLAIAICYGDAPPCFAMKLVEKHLH